MVSRRACGECVAEMRCLPCRFATTLLPYTDALSLARYVMAKYRAHYSMRAYGFCSVPLRSLHSVVISNMVRRPVNLAADFVCFRQHPIRPMQGARSKARVSQIDVKPPPTHNSRPKPTQQRQPSTKTRPRRTTRESFWRSCNWQTIQIQARIGTERSLECSRSQISGARGIVAVTVILAEKFQHIKPGTFLRFVWDGRNGRRAGGVELEPGCLVSLRTLQEGTGGGPHARSRGLLERGAGATCLAALARMRYGEARRFLGRMETRMLDSRSSARQAMRRSIGAVELTITQ